MFTGLNVKLDACLNVGEVYNRSIRRCGETMHAIDVRPFYGRRSTLAAGSATICRTWITGKALQLRWILPSRWSVSIVQIRGEPGKSTGSTAVHRTACDKGDLAYLFQIYDGWEQHITGSRCLPILTRGTCVQPVPHRLASSMRILKLWLERVAIGLHSHRKPSQPLRSSPHDAHVPRTR